MDHVATGVYNVNVVFSDGVAGKRKRGRPSKGFDFCKPRTKRRKLDQMRQQFSLEELKLLVPAALRAAGHTGAAKVISLLLENPASVDLKKDRKDK